jgi:hypothetical protein
VPKQVRPDKSAGSFFQPYTPILIVATEPFDGRLEVALDRHTQQLQETGAGQKVNILCGQLPANPHTMQPTNGQVDDSPSCICEAHLKSLKSGHSSERMLP